MGRFQTVALDSSIQALPPATSPIVS